jgi:hypothetical protein
MLSCAARSDRGAAYPDLVPLEDDDQLPEPEFESRNWLLRPSSFDRLRRPLATCLLCGVVTVTGHETCQRILAGIRDAGGGGAIVESPGPPPLTFSAEVPPRGTATATAFYSLGRTDPVDPAPLLPRVAPPWTTRGAAS